LLSLADLCLCLQLNLNHHLIGEELLELAENEVPPEDIVFHRFYLNKTGTVKRKTKQKDSVLDEDAGELLADNDADEASDESGDEILDLGDGLADDGEYDYDDLDSNAFEEEKDLLRDDSDVEFDDVSDDTASGDEGSENDDDIPILAGDSDGNLSDDEMVDAGKGGVSYTKKRRAGKKSGLSPFASLDDYEHLMVGDADATTAKRKHMATGRAGGEKKPKLRPRKKRSRSSE
jgi:ribosome biogenesis protein MAK21